jgi:hypothetical protein
MSDGIPGDFEESVDIASPVKRLTISLSIKPDNEIPAFAGYLSGSIKDPEIRVVINIEAMVNAVADKENEITFEEIFTTSVVHELLHAVQEIYKREFSEEEIEKVLMAATEMMYGS